MDFGGLFVLALIWAFFKLVAKSREESARPPRPTPRPGLGPLQDPPQEEGKALRMLLRELERAAQRPAGSAGRTVPRRPPAEDVEGRGSLEVDPRVESLEGPPLRTQRVTVDQDEAAEQVIARRAAATAARTVGRAPGGQGRVDPRLRQEPADRTATRPLTPQQLRDAMIWREILGPPVAERDR
jgi:hypothetical protein